LALAVSRESALSGICGILRLDGEAVDQRALDAMLRSLRHLGTDGAAALCDGPIGLGYQAHRVTQEDAFDAQPLAAGAGEVLLVADLRLDNREALAQSLAIRPAELDETPDSALLVAAYRRWGEACVDHLIGDFAFAIWDASGRRLILGRDHMGQRHLFFHRGDGFFAFATEIGGVWAAPDVPRRICEAGFEETLARRWHQRPAGRTKYEGIESLCGGTLLAVQADGAVTLRRYWEPHAAAQHLNRDETYYRQAYRRVLEEAVACRVRRATRPCSLLLSGGFDSAAIAALTAPALEGRKLVTVSSVLATTDESSPTSARRWVELCRRTMPHLDVRYATRLDRGIFSTLPPPDADGAGSVNRYVNDEMFRAAAGAGARVIMDGHGGDYTLNPRGHFPVARLLAMGRFREFLSEFVAQARAEKVPLWRSAWRDVLAAFVPSGLQRVRADLRAGNPLFGPAEPINRTFARRMRPTSARPAPQRYAPSLINARANLLRALRRLQDSEILAGTLSARHGLEFTQPFHDKRVVELALAIPEDLYFRGGRPRHLARTALADVLPPEFQTRSWRNIPRIPDLMDMAAANEPLMLAEIARLQGNPRLNAYFDFGRMRRMVVQRRADARNPWTASRVRRGMRSLIWALHIEWLVRDNACPAGDAGSGPGPNPGEQSTKGAKSGLPSVKSL
jgi:asparagine synthase (glutamine-hydrolysing)